jgi:hypothetical protein
MEIKIISNFVVPGVDDDEHLRLNRSEITLRAFFEKLSKRSPDPWVYVEPDADSIDPDDWEVQINAIPYQDIKEGLKKKLFDGDTVILNIKPQGGG